VDVGGTKIAAGVVDAEGALLRSASAPTPRGTDPEEVFGALRSAVEQVDPAGVRAVGVGSAVGPGATLAFTEWCLTPGRR